jgi:hypothetical protein
MYRRNASYAVTAASWLLGSGLVAAAACGGSAFSGDGAEAGGNAQAGAMAGKSNASGGANAHAGNSAASQAGNAAGAPTSGSVDGGEPAIAGAGAAGAGGEAGALDCSALNGSTFAEHCYADVTVESVTQVDAVAACAKLAGNPSGNAQLLVLDSPAEQAFIIEHFLTELTDAWLGLTCSSTLHSELTDCYCVDCEDTQLLQKRAVWSWLDGSTSTFGWSGTNPDGGGRCSALAFNPSTEKWGWVDRSCLSTSHQLTGFTPHSYRVLCELW